MNKRERVVEVPHGVEEARVAFFDEVVQLVHRALVKFSPLKGGGENERRQQQTQRSHAHTGAERGGCGAVECNGNR